MRSFDQSGNPPSSLNSKELKDIQKEEEQIDKRLKEAFSQIKFQQPKPPNQVQYERVEIKQHPKRNLNAYIAAKQTTGDWKKQISSNNITDLELKEDEADSKLKSAFSKLGGEYSPAIRPLKFEPFSEEEEIVDNTIVPVNPGQYFDEDEAEQVSDVDPVEQRFQQLEQKVTSAVQRSEMHSAGGGSNAVQFHEGGTMYGDLNIQSPFRYLSGGVDLSSLLTGGGSNLQQVTDVGASTTNTITAYGVQSDTLLLSASYTPSWQPGLMYFDTENDTMTFFNSESEVSMQVGQEMWLRARNDTGDDIANGEAVYVDGAQGNNPTVAKATAAYGGIGGHELIGVATHLIEDNSSGFITTFGVVRGIDTSNWTAGDSLYLSLTAGAITNTIPAIPSHEIRVGTALNSTNNGSILVDIRPGYEMEELHDISFRDTLQTRPNNSLLVFESSLSAWTDRSLAAVIVSGGFTSLTVTDAAYTVTDLTTYTYIVSTTVNSSFTLPDANASSDRLMNIKKVGSGNCKLSGFDSTQLIDKETIQTITNLETITVQCVGSEWFIV